MLPEFPSTREVPREAWGDMAQSLGAITSANVRPEGRDSRKSGSARLACRQGYTGLARRGPKMRDKQQGGADDCDTVYAHQMCSWRASKLLVINMLRQLQAPSHRSWRDMPASIDLSDESNTEITNDTGRRWAENLTRLDALPAVESTRIGGVTELETVRGGPSRVTALR